jgi:transcriptional regulator with XRE-family HTH domain
MGKNPPKPLTPGAIFGRRVKEERERQRLSQEEVVRRLAGLDRPMDRSNLGRIERGETTGQLDNVIALALALGCSPIHLMLPRDDEEEVEMAPKRSLSAADARAWLRGSKILDDGDPIAYIAAMSEEDQRAVVLAGVSPLALALTSEKTKAKAAESLRAAVDDVLSGRATARKRSRRKETEDG